MRSRAQFVGKAQVVSIGNDEYRMELIGAPGCIQWSEEDVGKDFVVSITEVDAAEFVDPGPDDYIPVLLGYERADGSREDLECYPDRMILDGDLVPFAEAGTFLRRFAARNMALHDAELHDPEPLCPVCGKPAGKHDGLLFCCAQCGGRASYHAAPRRGKGPEWRIRCDDCKVQTPRFARTDEARAAWNRRA